LTDAIAPVRRPFSAGCRHCCGHDNPAGWPKSFSAIDRWRGYRKLPPPACPASDHRQDNAQRWSTRASISPPTRSTVCQDRPPSTCGPADRAS
jgi:hypothetical protein